MKVKIVKFNVIFKVFKLLIYLVLLVVTGLIFYPNSAYSDLIFKILFVFILVLGVVKFFTTTFSVIGWFEYSPNRLNFVIGEKLKELEIHKIDRMSILINSYAGKSVGFSLRTHHGADNKVDIISSGQTYSFLFQLESSQDLNVFEQKTLEWVGDIKNITIRKSAL